MRYPIFTKKALAVAVAVSVVSLAGCNSSSSTTTTPTADVTPDNPYEIWASDQSNSAAGVTSGAGKEGSFIWIWDSAAVDTQVAGGANAQPLGCDGNNKAGDGPCDLNEVVTSGLVEDAGTDGTTQENGDAVTGVTGQTLGSQDAKIGRLHGMLPDPQNMYMNINSFAPGAGYVGIMDARTKEAVALFRVTKTDAGRSVHMSFWNSDGSALLIANLHGRLLERIDITRDSAGNITAAVLNRAASLSTQGVTVVDDATAFTGNNAQGRALVSSVSGTYSATALAATTPNGNNKTDGNGTGTDVGRPSGIIICPIVSDTGTVYVTLAGGGAIVANSNNTPMSVIGEYSNDDTDGGLNGVGCGGVQVNDTVWLNAGASAGSAGATQSIFTMYNVQNSLFNNHLANGTSAALNTPAATLIYKDDGNTNTGGNTAGNSTSNATGQIPGTTTRRDGHGMARTLDGAYIHNADRVQNTIEVFSTVSNSHVGTYDLTSEDGKGTGNGACATTSISDGGLVTTNDPAPDLMGTTPDGKYLVVALRGPAPVTVTHSAQGSCPGVGLITLEEGGKHGKLSTVLRTVNTTDNAAAAHVGGTDYAGAERSDPHGAVTRNKVSDGSGGFH